MDQDSRAPAPAWWQSSAVAMLTRALLVLAAILLVIPFRPVVRESIESTRTWIGVAFDYGQLRLDDRRLRSVLLARRYMQPGYSWRLLGAVGGEDALFQYLAYPDLHADVGSDYVAAFGSRNLGPQGWAALEVEPGVTVFARPGLPFANPPPLPEPYPMGTPLVSWAVHQAIALLTGLLLLAQCRIDAGRWGTLVHVGVAYATGAALVSSLLWAVAALGAPFAGATLLYGMGTLVAGLLLFRPERVGARMRGLLAPDMLLGGLPRNPAGWPVVAAAMAVLAILALHHVASPRSDAESLEHGLFAAKRLLVDQTFVAAEAPAVGARPALWPVHLAATYVMAGSVFDETAAWSVALLLAMGLFAAIGLVRMAGAGPSDAWLAGLVLLLMAPQVLEMAAHSDAWLAATTLACITLALRGVRHREGACAIPGIVLLAGAIGGIP